MSLLELAYRLSNLVLISSLELIFETFNDNNMTHANKKSVTFPVKLDPGVSSLISEKFVRCLKLCLEQWLRLD